MKVSKKLFVIPAALVFGLGLGVKIAAAQEVPTDVVNHDTNYEEQTPPQDAPCPPQEPPKEEPCPPEDTYSPEEPGVGGDNVSTDDPGDHDHHHKKHHKKHKKQSLPATGIPVTGAAGLVGVAGALWTARRMSK